MLVEYLIGENANPQFFMIIVLAVVYALTIHEFSHAMAANYLGDNTSKYSGRLSLNPLVHLDIMGTLMLLFAGFGWGKPVPVNIHNLRWRKWGEAFVSMAGPLSNFLSVILFVFLFKLLAPQVTNDNLLLDFIRVLIMINLILGIFNLIPIPPLDGSKVLFTLIPERYEHIKRWLAVNGMLVLIGLLLIDNFTRLNIFGNIFSFFINILDSFI